MFNKRVFIISNKIIHMTGIKEKQMKRIYNLYYKKIRLKNNSLIYLLNIFNVFSFIYSDFSLFFRISILSYICKQNLIKKINVKTRKIFIYFIVKMVKNLYSQRNNVISFRPISISTNIYFKDGIKLYNFQELCVSKIFNLGCINSGIILLPCGSGKTLLGISLISIINSNTLCIVVNTLLMSQWKNQILKWTHINPNNIILIDSFRNNILSCFKLIIDIRFDALVNICTYRIISYSGFRSGVGSKIVNKIFSSYWSVVMLDEAHLLISKNLLKTISHLKAKTIVGLTAIFPKKIYKSTGIGKVLGPILYKANNRLLALDGKIATLNYYDIIVNIENEDVIDTVVNNINIRKTQQYTKILKNELNKNKILICQFLKNHFENLGHYKILIYSDNIKLLKILKNILKVPLIDGKTSKKLKELTINNFNSLDTVNTILVSKAGDSSIDIPNANIIIQISLNQDSSIRKVQRAGRIMRANSKHKIKNTSFFFNITSEISTLKNKTENRRKVFEDHSFRVKKYYSKIINYYGNRKLVFFTTHSSLN
uniref:DNA 3'-5' helicase n=1 Tax=Amorphochlora amoebiformis TaxID=1561963 RepID=A0A0H5BI89_9EUKA|nr:DNA repair and transcription protein [Amorphochlora amoebiformis]